MLRTILFSIIVTILFLTACQSPPSQESNSTITPEETQIAKQLIQGSFDDLWAGMDSTKILNYHTEDFYILENGEVWSNQEIRNFMNKSLKNKDRAHRENKMEFLTLEKQGSAINIAYNNFATFSQGDSIVGKAQWLESALAIPTKDGWRLRMMHSTWVPQKQKAE